MSSPALSPSIAHNHVVPTMLKTPLIEDVISIFQKSYEFREIQSDNPLNIEEITNILLWQPLFTSVLDCISNCLVTKKSSLASKQKKLTKLLEYILESFVDLNYKDFGAVISIGLPGHTIGLIRLHASNVTRIIKCEMCNNVTEGGNKLRSIV